MMEDRQVPPPPPRPLQTAPVAVHLAQQYGYTKKDCRHCSNGHLAVDMERWIPCDDRGCLGTGKLWFKPGESRLNDKQLRAKYSSSVPPAG